MRGPNRPNHYDELKRASEGVAASEPETGLPEAQLTPNAQGIATDHEGEWAVLYEAKQTELDAAVASGRITGDDVVYKLRQFDNDAQVDDVADAASSQRRADRDREVDEVATENAQKLVEQAHTMRELHTRYETLGQGPVQLVEDKVLERTDGAAAPGDYFHDALKEQRNDRDPYGTLERTAMTELAMFQRDQERLDERIEAETDPWRQRTLEMRKDIQAADYVAATSNRIADQSEIITGSPETEDTVTFRERAAEAHDRSNELRAEYRDRTDKHYAPNEDEEVWVMRQGRTSQTSAEHVAQQAELQSPSEKTPEEIRDPSIEMSDVKREQLDRLGDFELAAGEVTRVPEGASRPPSGGGWER